LRTLRSASLKSLSKPAIGRFSRSIGAKSRQSREIARDVPR